MQYVTNAAQNAMTTQQLKAEALQGKITMEKSNISTLQSWGIASARHTSGVVLPREDGSAPGYFDVPQGPNLVRWDILRRKKMWAFQPHGDAVFCMRLSPDRRCIVTLSYGGEIGIWDTSYSCLYKGCAECSSLHHVSKLSPSAVTTTVVVCARLSFAQ